VSNSVATGISILLLIADPSIDVPENFRQYFTRTNEVRLELSEELESQIANLRVELKGAVGERKAILRKELTAAEKSFEELKKTNVTAFLPLAPKTEDIGAIRFLEIEALIDEKTAIVGFWRTRGKKNSGFGGPDTEFLIIHPIDTKPFKVRQKFNNPGLFEVTAVDAKDKPLALDSRLKGYTKFQKLEFIVSPIKSSDVSKYRKALEAEKKK
jgi:hypothetical protein